MIEITLIKELNDWIDEKLEYRFIKGLEKKYENRYNQGWYACLNCIKGIIKELAKKDLKNKKFLQELHGAILFNDCLYGMKAKQDLEEVSK